VNVLFGKCFGLGNAVMSVPAIKALASMGHSVDVLIGSTSDDTGAWDVFSRLKESCGCIRDIYVDAAIGSPRYDVAIMSIPFDGRWRKGHHFDADRIIDARTRPDPSTTGLVSWEKHEIEYQMDNVYDLGYRGDVPDCSFMSPEEWALRPRVFYLGVGYKKDAAGFWKFKHWGNERYAELVKMVLDENPMNLIYTSGDMADLQLSINPISRVVQSERFVYVPGNLRTSLDLVKRCGTYFGNDTGMMHVAAACGAKTIGIFMDEKLVTKNHPWTNDWSAIHGWKDVPVREISNKIVGVD